MVSWGTSPDQSLAITAAVPGPEDLPAERRADAIRAMAYMDLAPHTPLQDIAIDRAFIGSCTNARSEEHTSELQSLMRISYAVFCLKKKTTNIYIDDH